MTRCERRNRSQNQCFRISLKNSGSIGWPESDPITESIPNFGQYADWPIPLVVATQFQTAIRETPRDKKRHTFRLSASRRGGDIFGAYYAPSPPRTQFTVSPRLAINSRTCSTALILSCATTSGLGSSQILCEKSFSTRPPIRFHCCSLIGL